MSVRYRTFVGVSLTYFNGHPKVLSTLVFLPRAGVAPDIVSADE
jgi:hypothetical protein